MLFKLAFFFFAFTAANQDFFVWPELFVTSTDEILIHVFCFAEKECEMEMLHCGAEPVALTPYKVSNLTSETGNYILDCAKFNRQECSKGATEVTFKLNGIDQRIRFHDQAQIATNVHREFAIKTDLCPTNSAFGYWTLPCEKDIVEICETAHICDGVFGLGRTESLHKTRDNSNFIAKKHGRDCKLIYVTQKRFSCSSFSLMADESKTHFNSKICFIGRAEFRDEKLVIEVPTRIGQHVCIDYSHGRSGKTDQQCTVAYRRTTEFALSTKVRNLRITCDGQISNSFEKEIIDMNCPMLFVKSSFAKLICKDAYRPVMFWVSMTWLIIGLPCVWALMIFYYKYKCWMYMRKFWKSNTKCEYCKDTILSELDLANHDRCSENICPHCSKIQYSSKDLMRHSVKCDKRDSAFEKTREILNWETSGFKCKYDINTIHKTKKFKVVWFVLFVLVFMSSFVPSFGSECDHWQRCARIVGKLRIDNSHVPARDIPVFIPPNGHGNNDAEKNPDEIYRATSTVIDALAVLKNEINHKIKNIEVKVDETMRNNLMDFGAQIELLLTKKAEEEVCKRKIRDFDFNTFLPESLQHPNFAKIMVHIESEFAVHQLATVISDSLNKQSESRTGIYAGPDAVVQQGRDYQHAQGGSGGRNQFGLSGSSNFDTNQDDNYDPRSTIHRNAASTQNDYSDLLTKLHSRSKRSAINIREMSQKVRDLDVIKNKRIEELNEDIQLEVDKSRLKMDKEIGQYRKNSDELMSISDVKIKEVNHKGVKHSIKEMTLSHAKPLTTKKETQVTHDKWFDFHDTKGHVCEVNCLHEPSTCECIKGDAPKSGKYQLPWTSLQTSDIHLSNNPMSFRVATTSIDREDYDNLYLKTDIDATFDLFEGTNIIWKIKSEGSTVEPTVSVVIPRISQVYHSSFLYYTCEREFETEVKGLCTGSCLDYCGGKVCVGSRIWKWANCRKLSCNPSWCWATDDGCCCCGSNVMCPHDKKIGSVWAMEYLRTEFLLCVFYNDRIQNCRLVDSTQTLDFGAFTVGVTRVIDAGKKLSRHIFAVHEQRTDVGKMSKANVWGHPSEIYIDPPVCVGEQQCNHGYIGDVQIEEISCLPQLGTFCKEDISDLNKGNCTKRVFVSHANTDMHMECHFAKHHTCSHEGVVRKMNFADRLQQTEKLEDHFTIKKLLMDYSKRSMLLYPLPRENIGTVSLKIEGRGIMVPKKEKKPTLENLMIVDCQGCYLCHVGFTCSMSVDLLSPDMTLVTLKSETDLIDFNLSPVTLKRGNNMIKIWGIAYGEVNNIKGCMNYGQECLKTFTTRIELKKPIGQFVPNFETLSGSGQETNSCQGWAWFSCLAASVTKFFGDIWENIWEFLIIFGVIALLVVAIFFMPQVVTMMIACFNVCCKKRPRGRMVLKGKHVNDVYRDLSEKRKKYENKKKTDVDDLELEELLIQKEDVDFTTP